MGSPAFEAFWAAVDTDAALQKRLTAQASPQVIVQIAAEFGFQFTLSELDEDQMAGEGHQIQWGGSESWPKRVPYSMTELRLDRIESKLQQLEDHLRMYRR